LGKPLAIPRGGYNIITQESFFILLSLIDNHPILHNNSNVPQQPEMECNHDTRLWENCNLNQHKETFFSPGQVLIGDSGFPKGQSCACVQKTTPWTNAMTEEKVSPAPCGAPGLQMELSLVETMKRIFGGFSGHRRRIRQMRVVPEGDAGANRTGGAPGWFGGCAAGGPEERGGRRGS
ncbi:hypothetical protein VP01_7558g1, partial [Puccinia sorghi]